MSNKVTVSCPKCKGTEFTECSTAPIETDINEWRLQDGLPHPDDYGSHRSYIEMETLDEQPYKCSNCDQQFTAAQLVIEG